MLARIYSVDKSFIYEGRAEYDREAKTIYIRGGKSDVEKVAALGGDCLVHYTDSAQGVFDFYCRYTGFEQDGVHFDMVMLVDDIIQTTQRRQDLKMKTNISIKLTLLDQGDKVLTDPETMRSVTVPAMLRDISAGGIMIDTERELPVNQKLLFPFDKGSSPIMVSAQVIREQPPVNDYYRYGCRFINNTVSKESIIREYVFRLETGTRHAARSAYD